ncbi:hypothetical protein ACEWY4_020634 [Coilia grayii]|uniref:Signal-induced proliferation-associated 1-like protein C-terminal domain-containing protein n=1 Tax=Coilia grayii TaxID=363190 RepID=A0ABD1J842_9TELE
MNKEEEERGGGGERRRREVDGRRKEEEEEKGGGWESPSSRSPLSEAVAHPPPPPSNPLTSSGSFCNGSPQGIASALGAGVQLWMLGFSLKGRLGGCSELYRIPMVEYKLDSEGTPCEYKTPFKRNTTWHRVPTPANQPLPRGSPTQGPERLHCQQILQHGPSSAIPRSTSFDRKLPDGPRTLQDVEHPQVVSCGKGGDPRDQYRSDPRDQYRSSPSNQSSSSDPGPSGSSTWAHQPGYDGCQSPVLHERVGEGQGMLGEGEGLRDREHTLERTRSAEAKWHIPSTKILNSLKERGKDSPNKLSRTGDKSSSHSSSNTLSSSGSCSAASEEKAFGSADPMDPMDPEVLGLTYIKGASTDSGIDTAPGSSSSGGAGGACARVASQGRGALEPGHPPWGGSAGGGGEDGAASADEEHAGKLYLPQAYSAALVAGHVTDGSMGDLSELSSHSSGSPHSGSPRARGSRYSASPDLHRPPLSATGPTLTQEGHTLTRRTGPEDRPSQLTEPPSLSGCGQMYMAEMASRMRESERAGKLQPGMSKEEYLKMMLPDSPPGDDRHRKSSASGSLSPRRSLYRTLSDESVCSSNRKCSSYSSSRSSMLDQALPSDILFSSTPPYHSTLPPRMGISQPGSNLRSEFWYSDGSLADRAKFSDPGLMPLPDTASDLDWSHLVDAARAFEGTWNR